MGGGEGGRDHTIWDACCHNYLNYLRTCLKLQRWRLQQCAASGSLRIKVPESGFLPHQPRPEGHPCSTRPATPPTPVPASCLPVAGPPALSPTRAPAELMTRLLRTIPCSGLEGPGRCTPIPHGGRSPPPPRHGRPVQGNQEARARQAGTGTRPPWASPTGAAGARPGPLLTLPRGWRDTNREGQG